MHNGRLFTLLGAIFGVLGLVLLGTAGALAISSASFLSSAQRADGTVVGMTEEVITKARNSSGHRRRDTVWHPTVEFTADGRKYTFRDPTGSKPPAYEKGDSVSVVYEPGDPAGARIASFSSGYLTPLISGGVGLLLTPVGGVLFVRGRRAARLRTRLREQGHQVWARIDHVGRDLGVRVNNQHPYVIHATWQDERTGHTYTATSDNLRDDPAAQLQGRTHVRVLYDPADPTRNLVDLGT